MPMPQPTPPAANRRGVIAVIVAAVHLLVAAAGNVLWRAMAYSGSATSDTLATVDVVVTWVGVLLAGTALGFGLSALLPRTATVRARVTGALAVGVAVPTLLNLLINGGFGLLYNALG